MSSGDLFTPSTGMIFFNNLVSMSLGRLGFFVIGVLIEAGQTQFTFNPFTPYSTAKVLEKALNDAIRVLKPGGIFVVLETSVPTKFPFKQGYYLHSNVVLPLVGKLFSKDKSAYTYLSKSASKFPYGIAFNNILKKIGFIDSKALPQTFGVATIYTATKK